MSFKCAQVKLKNGVIVAINERGKSLVDWYPFEWHHVEHVMVVEEMTPEEFLSWSAARGCDKAPVNPDKCKRCGLGIDNDHDGNCIRCPQFSDEDACDPPFRATTDVAACAPQLGRGQAFVAGQQPRRVVRDGIGSLWPCE